MVKRLLPLIPYARTYVEPFGGAATVLMSRRPSPVEVYNDLNGDLVNLFRVLQDEQQYRLLEHRLRWTPYSRAEFVRALDILKRQDANQDPVDRAWAFFVAQRQIMGGLPAHAATPADWGYTVTTTRRGMAERTSDWLSALDMLPAWRERIMRVQIEQLDALDCIQRYDTPETVFYVDPPYLLDTRKDRAVYEHEMTESQYAALVETLLGCQGVVVLSCYDHPVYEPLREAGWERFEFTTASHAAVRSRTSGLQGQGAALAKVPRTEVVYRSRAGDSQPSLFTEVVSRLTGNDQEHGQ